MEERDTLGTFRLLRDIEDVVKLLPCIRYRRQRLELGGIGQLTADIATYAEETAASAEQMSATTQQTNASTQEIVASVAQLSDHSAKLSRLTEQLDLAR